MKFSLFIVALLSTAVVAEVSPAKSAVSTTPTMVKVKATPTPQVQQQQQQKQPNIQVAPSQSVGKMGIVAPIRFKCRRVNSATNIAIMEPALSAMVDNSLVTSGYKSASKKNIEKTDAINEEIDAAKIEARKSVDIRANLQSLFDGAVSELKRLGDETVELMRQKGSARSSDKRYTAKEPHAARKRRWNEFNHILSANKKKLKTNDSVDYSNVHMESSERHLPNQRHTSKLLKIFLTIL
ncbi:hypothetical protein BDR26DRAFT_1012941 [Obelidium mucronatum]|nr:hypothetical protein BDR26DRAFT_1012941 [Obelidium mucronatum]